MTATNYILQGASLIVWNLIFGIIVLYYVTILRDTLKNVMPVHKQITSQIALEPINGASLQLFLYRIGYFLIRLGAVCFLTPRLLLNYSTDKENYQAHWLE